MGKNVVVIASGETERRSLPHLLVHLQAEGVTIANVLIPPRGRAITVEMAEKLVKAAWFGTADPPDKLVILLDIDGNSPDDVVRPFREQLPARIGATLGARLQFAYAQWHLEAWYFADATRLRDYLGRDLGSVDSSKPDEIRDPKRHLKQLLGERAYTAVVSEEIARRLNGPTIGKRSPSFQGLLAAVRNGTSSPQD